MGKTPMSQPAAILLPAAHRSPASLPPQTTTGILFLLLFLLGFLLKTTTGILDHHRDFLSLRVLCRSGPDGCLCLHIDATTAAIASTLTHSGQGVSSGVYIQQRVCCAGWA